MTSTKDDRDAYQKHLEAFEQDAPARPSPEDERALTALLAQGLAAPRPNLYLQYLAQCEDVLALKKSLERLIDHVEEPADSSNVDRRNVELRDAQCARQLLIDIDARLTKDFGLLPR